MAEESDKRWVSPPDGERSNHAGSRRDDPRSDDFFGADAVKEPGVDQQERSDLPGDVLFDALNDSLDDVIVLLEREIDRLKSSLEVYRDSEHPNRRDIMRMHVDALDRRQDTLDEMRDLLKQTG